MPHPPLTPRAWDDLDGEIACPDCGSRTRWEVDPASHRRRANSETAVAACAGCGAGLFLKRVLHCAPDADRAAEARREFDTLRRVHAAFRASELLGLAEPVALSERGTCIVSRLCAGDGLLARLHASGHDEAVRLVFSSGRWLAELHRCGGARQVDTQIGRRLDVVEDLWRDTAAPPAPVRRALLAMRRSADAIDGSQRPGFLLHGDFTPDNLLVDGSRMIGVDIQWKHRGLPEMDLAPFLNHLAFAGTGIGRRRLGRRLAALETAFLEGYFGDVPGDLRLLAWHRLYFLLSALASARASLARRVLARLEVMPAVARVTEQLATPPARGTPPIA